MEKKAGINRWVFFIPAYIMVTLFLALYLILAFNARFTGDDFFYLWLRKLFGSWNGMIYQYNDWSGRWTAHYVACKLISGWTNILFLPVIFLSTLTLLYSSVQLGLKKILKFYCVELSKNNLSLFCLLFVATFFFSCYGIGETWFWYIIVITYLWSLIGFVFSLGLIFSGNNKFVNYLLIAVFSAFSGGASESFAMIFLSLLLVFLLYRMISLQISLQNSINMKILFAIVFLAASLVFSIIAPGTEIRLSLLPETSMVDKLWIAAKSFGKYFIIYLPEKIGYIVLFAFPWVIVGSNFIKNRYEKIQIRRWFIRSTLFFILLLAVMFIPTSFIMSETGPDRALSIISFLTTIYFSLLFVLLGAIIHKENILLRYCYFIVSLISISFTSCTIFNQLHITANFSNACDERMLIIQNAYENKFDGILGLDKIPDAGMLHWEEITADTSHFNNKHLKNGLELPFAVKLTESEIYSIVQ